MSPFEINHSPYQAGRRHWLLVIASGALALTAGCTTPKEPPETPVSLNLIAGSDVNPDARGRASPLTVRVYALKSSSAFTSADFFSLYDKDAATLGADLIQREEMTLHPGETRKLNFVLKPDAKAIGVIAAYRDLERARWRELSPLNPGKALDLDLRFGALRIQAAPR
jgi:type VI secretion system protein VasD